MSILSMAYDTNCIFSFKRCVFEYKNRLFVIYCASDNYHMSIDTYFDGTNRDRNRVFETIHEFLYLYGWHNNCYFYYLGSASMSGTKDLLLKRNTPLYREKMRYIDLQLFYNILDSNCSNVIKNAISLYNDGLHSNDDAYAFLCYYKVIDLFNDGNSSSTVDWINNNIDNIESNWTLCNEFIKNTDNIGKWLKNTCRNRIAHILLYDKKEGILSYKSDDLDSLIIGQHIMKLLAELIIKQNMSSIKLEKINIIQVD